MKIDITPAPPRSKKQPNWLVWLTVVVVATVVTGTLFFRRMPPAMPAAEPPGVPAASSQADLPESNPLITLSERIRQWVSPTAGPPITLEYVPLGAQALIHLRPAELIAHPEGAKVLAALGPWGEQNIRRIEESLAVPLGNVEALLIALHRGSDGWQFALRATLVEAWSEAEIKRNSARATDDERTLFAPPSGQGKVIVSCRNGILAELQQRGSEPAFLSRDLERLLPHTDAERTATVLFPARFLDTEGRELFLGGGERIISAYKAVVPDNASAVALSVDWRNDFFCELRATRVQNEPGHRFTTQLTDRLKAAEEALATDLKYRPPSRHGQAVESRFPVMTRILALFTRTSQEGDIAVTRVYLPIHAGHNLLLASRLRLDDTAPATAAVEPRLTLAERLGQLTTLAFPRETLENALEILARDAGIPIQIDGRDLQLEGITKNQSLAIEARDRPVEEVLVELLRKANPDPDATGPSDPRQKLVYVIQGDTIQVTTRSAAAQRGEQLPAVFRSTGQ